MGHLYRCSETLLNILVLVVLRACLREELEALSNLHLLQVGDGLAIGQSLVRWIVILGEYQKNGHLRDISDLCRPFRNIHEASSILRADTDQKSVGATE